jgi:hypothetical protein
MEIDDQKKKSVNNYRQLPTIVFRYSLDNPSIMARYSLDRTERKTMQNYGKKSKKAN